MYVVVYEVELGMATAPVDLVIKLDLNLARRLIKN